MLPHEQYPECQEALSNEAVLAPHEVTLASLRINSLKQQLRDVRYYVPEKETSDAEYDQNPTKFITELQTGLNEAPPSRRQQLVDDYLAPSPDDAAVEKLCQQWTSRHFMSDINPIRRLTSFKVAEYKQVIEPFFAGTLKVLMRCPADVAKVQFEKDRDLYLENNIAGGVAALEQGIENGTIAGKTISWVKRSVRGLPYRRIPNLLELTPHEQRGIVAALGEEYTRFAKYALCYGSYDDLLYARKALIRPVSELEEAIRWHTKERYEVFSAFVEDDELFDYYLTQARESAAKEERQAFRESVVDLQAGEALALCGSGNTITRMDLQDKITDVVAHATEHINEQAHGFAFSPTNIVNELPETIVTTLLGKSNGSISQVSLHALPIDELREQKGGPSTDQKNTPPETFKRYLVSANVKAGSITQLVALEFAVFLQKYSSKPDIILSHVASEAFGVDHIEAEHKRSIVSGYLLESFGVATAVVNSMQGRRQ